jgi:hypothetical protein
MFQDNKDSQNIGSSISKVAKNLQSSKKKENGNYHDNKHVHANKKAGTIHAPKARKKALSSFSIVFIGVSLVKSPVAVCVVSCHCHQCPSTFLSLLSSSCWFFQDHGSNDNNILLSSWLTCAKSSNAIVVMERSCLCGIYDGLCSS